MDISGNLDVTGDISINSVKIAGNTVLTSTELGSTITSSSLTSVGELSSLNVSGDISGNKLTITGDASFNNNLDVSGDITSNNLYVNNEAIIEECYIKHAHSGFVLGNKNVSIIKKEYALYQSDTGNTWLNTPSSSDGIIFSVQDVVKARIETNGNVRIKYNMDIGYIDPSENFVDPSFSYALDVSGDINATGDVRSSGTILTSDDRIKHNEKIISNGLSLIDQLQPKQYFKTKTIYDASHDFDLDASGNPIDASGNKLVEGNDYTIENGIIAQSIKDIPDLKHVVKGDEEQGILSVDYNSIHCTHIAATRELHQKVKTLEETVELLKAEIELLKQK